MNTKISETDYKFFLFFSLFWVILGWLGFVLAILGIFYSWIFIVYGLLTLFFFVYLSIKKKLFFKISKEFAIVLASIFIITTAYSLFVTPSIFSGRDQGSISEAAIRLSLNHQLKFSTPASSEFYQIYGPGKALNFPGFFYTNEGKLITGFPIPYSAWLAIFFSYFQLGGFIFANTIFLFLFFCSFYLLIRQFCSFKHSFIFLLASASTFTFYWFYKYTLTENMMLFLLWFSILSLLIYQKERGRLALISFLASSGLMFFIRIEGIAFFALILGVFFWLNKKELKGLFLKAKIITLLFSGFAIIFFLNFWNNYYSYKEIIKAFIFSKSLEKLVSIGIFEKLIGQYSSLALYGLLGFLLFGIIGIAYFIKKKNKMALVPFLIILPTFIYLINPWISSDHPWMLRRFAFSIIPGFIFYSAIFSEEWKNKINVRFQKLFLPIVISALFFMNLPAFVHFFTFSENKNLLPQIKSLSENFSNRDLVLIDSQSNGDGWQMITGPMGARYGKNTVYIFNINDIAKINFQNFDRVFLLVPNNKSEIYESALPNFNFHQINKYNLNTQYLSLGNGDFFPEKMKVSTNNMLFEINKK